MPEAVVDANEISLNGVRYRITRPVQTVLASLYPGKVVIGDVTRDSNPALSVLSLTDHRGGIGLDVMEGEEGTNRSWYSTCDTRYKGHLILPPLVTTTGGLPAGAAGFDAPVTFDGAVFAHITATTSGIYRYNNSTNTWGSTVNAETSVNCSIAGQIAGTLYIVYGANTKYVYSTNGTTWTTVTTASPPQSMVIWADRLWWLATDGLLYFATNIGDAGTADARLPLLEAFTTPFGRLAVGPDSQGNPIIYAATAEGLFAHDAENARFVQTGLALPPILTDATMRTPNVIVWRGDIYFSFRESIFRYNPRGGGLITLMGPDRDHGLPTTKGNIVSWMSASLNDIIIQVGGTSPDADLILAWNGVGWRVLFDFGAYAAMPYGSPHVSGAYAVYRAWFSEDQSPYNMRYLALPRGMVNPLQLSTYTYAASATHDWPWFTAGQNDVDKVAVRVNVEVNGASADETVTLSYALNYSTSFTSFAAITTNGVTTFDFPNSTTPTGTTFRAIRLRVALARGSTNTNTPDVIAVTLEYYKKLKPKWGFMVEVDISTEYKSNTPQALRENLVTAIESVALVEYTHRDPDKNTNATFYVQVRSATNLEYTGVDERGTSQLVLTEV